MSPPGGHMGPPLRRNSKMVRDVGNGLGHSAPQAASLPNISGLCNPSPSVRRGGPKCPPVVGSMNLHYVDNNRTHTNGHRLRYVFALREGLLGWIVVEEELSLQFQKLAVAIFVDGVIGFGPLYGTSDQAGFEQLAHVVMDGIPGQAEMAG